MEVKKTQKNIPSGWKEKSLLDCLKTSSKITGINLSEYEKEGNFPVFDQSQNYISGYSSRKDLVVENVPAILFGDHTRIVKYIKSPFVAGADGTKIFWAKNGFDPMFLYYLVLNQKIPNTGYNRHFKFFKDIKVTLPESKNEQQRIAEILGIVDEDIAKTQELIEVTEKLKRGLMQQLFTRGIGHTKFKQSKLGEIPEEWVNLSMENVCVVRQGLQIPISERFKDPASNRYVYLTIQYLRDAHLPDVAEYIENPPKGVICKSDDILMTRTGNTGKVLTGIAGVFHNNFFLVDYNRNKIDKQFFVYYLNSDLIQKMIKVRAGSTTIPDLNHGDFYSLPLALPPRLEQQRISEILLALDEKISVNKKLKEKLTLLKKGLMQDLLTGNKRVTK